MIAINFGIIRDYFTSITTCNGIAIEIDDSFIDFTGYSNEDVYNKQISFILSELLKMRIDMNKMNIEQQIKSTFMFTKNYIVKEIYLAISPGNNPNQTIYTFIEKSDSRIEDKFIFLERLFSGNVVGIGVYSIDDLILIKANERYLDFFEEPYNNFKHSLGCPVFEIMKNWTGSPMEKIWQTVIDLKQPCYIKERKCERFGLETTYWDTIIVPVLDKGELKYIYEYCLNATERINVQEKIEVQSEFIKTQKEQLESILLNMSDGLFIINENRQIRLLNESARNFFHIEGNTQNDMDNIEHIKYYDTEGNEVHISDFANKLSNSKVNSTRLMSQSYLGVKHFDVSGSPIFDQYDGHIKEAIICARDVTEFVENGKIIREQKENLLKAEIEKNQILEKMIMMKDEFLSTISHEFKTPLNVINSAIQAMELLCKDELSLRAKRYINSIRQNAFRQLRLVNNLLDITRSNAGKMKLHKKNMDIVFLTRSIVKSVYLYAQQKQIKLDFVSSVDEKIIGIDEEKYERILLNLISNALKFTPMEKRIKVKLSLIEKYVRIEVKDNGIGIPKDMQEVIFERFGQVDSSLSRQAEGTGIGLSLVKALVNVLDGQISVKSTENKGSSFIILLPDERVADELVGKSINELTDNRLVQAIAIEFSDIYLS